MFNKRFVTVILAVLLALVLGTAALAQDNDADFNRGENSLLEWLDSLHSTSHSLDEESGWRLFEPLEKLIREAAEKAQSDRVSNGSRISALNAIQPESLQDLVAEWPKAFQSRESANANVLQRVFKQVIDRLSDIFNIPQLAPMVNGNAQATN